MAVKDILTDSFLTFIANEIGSDWRLFFTHLGFESHHMDHFKYNRNDLFDINLEGLRKWRKQSLQTITKKDIPELVDFIVEGLKQVKRRDIADEITDTLKSSGIDKIIDLISLKLTTYRYQMFDYLGIALDDVDKICNTPDKSLKDGTSDILTKWHDDHVIKYWKYQQLLNAFKERGHLDRIREITNKYKISVFSSGSVPSSPDIVNTTEHKRRHENSFDDEACKEEPKKGRYEESKVNENQMCFTNTKSKEAEPVKRQDTIGNEHETCVTNSESMGAEPVKRNDYIESRDCDNSDEKKGKSDEDPCSSESNRTGKVINTTIQLRKYQEELAEVALRGENTIVCSATGAGKTYVAFHIILEHLKRYPTAKVVFLARTNLLLHQQHLKAKKVLKIIEDAGDIIKHSVGQEIEEGTSYHMFDKGRLFFMTPQSLMNRLNSNQKFPVDINTFSLIVFDECHNVHGTTRYNDIMAVYREYKFKKGCRGLPQIIGLTASHGTNRAGGEKAATEHLLKVMAKMDVVKISTVQRELEDLNKHVVEAERVMKNTRKRNKNPVHHELMNAISTVENVFKEKTVYQFLDSNRPDTDSLIKILNSLPAGKMEQTYAQWITETRLIVEGFLKTDDFIPRLLLACLRHLEIYTGCMEINSLLDINEVTDMLKSKFNQEEKESGQANTQEEKSLIDNLKTLHDDLCSLNPEILEQNPDIQEIIGRVKQEYNKQGKDSRFLIFVKTRATATALAKRLGFLTHLNCQYFTGSQVGTEDGGLTQKQQRDIIDKFRSGHHKCIVATNIASEGIDIPECNLVIRYRIITYEIESQQMRGRVRKEGKDIYVGSAKETQREIINVARQILIKIAIDNVFKMSEKELLGEVIKKDESQLYQYEEAQRMDFQAEQMETENLL